MEVISPEQVKEAYDRIAAYIIKTPVYSSSLLNGFLGNEIYFKLESFQKIGAFKFRGALNALLVKKEQGELPKEVVTVSSGNHAQAVALSGRILGIKTTVFIPGSASKVKYQAAASYGAEVVLTPTRQDAEAEVLKRAKAGAYYLPPYDDDDVIAGQGTACYEVLTSGLAVDAMFATCGGGGWLSGSFLAKELLRPQAKIFAGEPALGNDASRSYQSGEIEKLPTSPMTIADGARTLAISQRTFHYLKQLDGFFEASEDEIIYWTQWLMHLLKTTVEPTSAVAMAAAHQWIKREHVRGQKLLVLISGGNISPETYLQIWEKNRLEDLPGR